MAKAVELIVDQNYVSDFDKDETKTTWTLRALTCFEYMDATKEGFVNHGAIVGYGLTGWKDFPDENGDQIEFSVENMKYIPPLIAQDLSLAIQNIAALSEDERKNS